MATKHCEGCGKVMEGANAQRRTCSGACRQRVHQNRKNGVVTKQVNAADWPSPFAATLAGLNIAQRHKLKVALDSDPRLAAQAQVPVGVAVGLIALPPSELRRELGPTASLRPYGWEDGAALDDFIGRLNDVTGEQPNTEA